jgi:AAA ATPase domain
MQSEPVLTSALGPHGGRPLLIGRADETRVLSWALDELAAGRGAILELTGDPGIGKTRQLTELADQAERRGLLVPRAHRPGTPDRPARGDRAGQPRHCGPALAEPADRGHLSRVYRKLNLPSRAALASLVASGPRGAGQ